ncbi:hypothetical protein NP590_15165 [Methylomonas sp. SURF-2]|uniref:Uncharacterized protein n=1 Tax=Methylomonas subterranea TaxID=2952225 RepID=A0ABT1TK43_9GAMM|nr:hypothetical protein [Methylomonas sp. SURF-2]MCQ8105452.1 hypothetical protein [Methylomonas sp. SURF-2]
MNTRTAYSILVLFILIGLQSARAAGEFGFYSGSNCKAVNGADTSSFRTDTVGIWYTSNTSGNKSVLCPITRQNPLNNNGTQSVAIKVRSSGGDALTCTSQALDANSNLVASKTASTTSSSVTSLNLTLDKGGVFGTYVIFCNLPPHGSVWNYTVIEK